MMRCTVAGATGLIGGLLVEMLQENSVFTSVNALTRHRRADDGKVKWIEVDFESDPELLQATAKVDAVFCCLGTTMKAAGSKQAFRKVDYDYVVRLAAAAKKNGVRKFLVVSAMGANASSSIFYNKVKGEMEHALGDLAFADLVIMQPSLLLGSRDERRIGEKIGTVAMRLIAPLMLGSLRKYRPIQARDVAKSMMAEAIKTGLGHRILRYDALLAEA